MKSFYPADRRRTKPLFFIGTFVAVVVLIYANTFQSPFVFDDLNYITKNDPHVHMTELSWAQLSEAAFEGKPHNRPIANLSFAINHYFNGKDPTGYHVVNLAIHLLTALFLFLLIEKTLRLLPAAGGKARQNRFSGPPDTNTAISPAWIAFFAALLWAIHPVQTHAVTYIVQRMTSLAAMFYILSLLFYVQGRMTATAGRRKRGAAWFAGCAAAAVCAFATKQNTGTLPLFILLYEWYFFRDLRPVQSGRLVFGGLIAAAAFCAIAFVYLGFDPMERILAAYGRRDFTLPQRIFTEWRVVAYYISLLVFPHPGRLNLDHDYPLSQAMFDPVMTAVSALMIIGLVTAALYTARRDRIVSFALLWFAGNLVIESSVIGIEIIFEHRLYLPSMMMALLAVRVFARYMPARWPAGVPKTAPLVIAAVVLCLWTWQRNQVWATDVAFWRDCTKKSPEKARPLYNLAFSLQNRGEYAAAVRYYRRALREPNPAAYYNMGLALNNLGHYEEAVGAFFNAVKMDYKPAGIHNHIGIALANMGEFKSAMQHYRRAAKRQPKDRTAKENLSAIADFLKRCGTPVDCVRKHLEKHPDNAALHYKLGVLHEKRGNREKARKRYRHVLDLLPESPRKVYMLALRRLADTHYRMGQSDSALALYRKGIRLAPGHVDYYYEIAAIYAEKQNRQKAVTWLQRAVEKGFSDLSRLRTDRRLDSIRHTEAFKKMKSRLDRGHKAGNEES